MTSPVSISSDNRPVAGIVFVLVGMLAISVNDMLIKYLSGGYPLHQIVLFRSVFGLGVSVALVAYEGGLALLRTSHPGLHVLRGVLVVVANMTFFAALAALPLAEATALFFAAPLFITVLSIVLLGEKVGPWRMGAVIFGFAGVVVMQRPWAGSDELTAARIVLLLPVLAALTYALNQILTRRLGRITRASVLSLHIQVTFILVSLTFWAVAGDGRFAEGTESESLRFLLRAWIWPPATDWPVLIGLGLNGGVIGYCLSQAYRIADAATVAPFEYAALPLAVFWGWYIYADLPDPAVWAGMALILTSGLVVFLRERRNARRASAARVGGRT